MGQTTVGRNNNKIRQPKIPRREEDWTPCEHLPTQGDNKPKESGKSLCEDLNNSVDESRKENIPHLSLKSKQQT